MSAFVDPEAHADVALPECHCPGTPHDHDTVTIRTEYGYGDLVELARVHTSAGRIDPMAERAKLLELGIVGWSFVDKQGEPVPIGLPMILLLKQSIVDPVAEAIDTAFQGATEPVPNGSSGPSRHSLSVMVPASTNRAQRRASKRSAPRSSSASA